jgi:hypothetical protein
MQAPKIKKVGIMQPYFFPYLGYFSLIKHTDTFILLDTVQYMRHGWIERNRILKQGDGWLYVKVPLIKDSRESLIKDIKLDKNQPWATKVKAQMQVYRKTAPYYSSVAPLIEEVLAREYEGITELNKASMGIVCDYLGIENDIRVFSEMDVNIVDPNAPDEWALNICIAMDIKEYWNPPGGRSFFDKSKYDKAGVKIRFHEIEPYIYNQGNREFEPGLSAIDTLMFNSINDINGMLDKYELT